MTWTQCKPCVKSCYDQVDPIFDPSASSSYANISCASSVCGELVSATSVNPGCSSSTCVYGIQYGDNSFSVGYFAKERISLGSADYIDGYLFGCGENNQGLFKGAAGLLGLGRNQLSLVSQAADKYGKCFSHCLPEELLAKPAGRTFHIYTPSLPDSFDQGQWKRCNVIAPMAVSMSIRRSGVSI